MAASFIRKNNGLYYLRLTNSTNTVKFAGVAESANTYTFSVDGTVYVSKPNNDNGTIFYTSSANPAPAGGSLNNGRFPGSETNYNFSNPTGTVEYQLSFTSSGPGTQFWLGGDTLTWGGYAYPGSGYLQNPVTLGIKVGGVWKNCANVFIKKDNVWQEVRKIYDKSSNTWRLLFQNYGNSSWINMIEGTDDAIDFAVKVIALN